MTRMCRERHCLHRWVDTNTGSLTYAGQQRALDTTWDTWVVQTNATTASNRVWSDWTTCTYASSTTITVNVQDWRVNTPEQAAAWALAEAEELQRRRQRRAEREQREAEREQAAARAEELLVSCLDGEQQAELRIHNRFHVTAPSGRRYCIHRGRAGNVTAPDGTRQLRYCIHDYVGLPDADTMLAQKLLLETDEEEFLRVANASVA